MTSSATNNEFFALMSDLAEDRLSSEGAAALAEMLRGDPALQRKYVDYLLVVGGLHRIRGEGRTAAGAETSSLDRLDFESPLVAPAISPLPTLPTTLCPPSTAFVGGPVFSYLVATVVLCLMLLGAWAYKINHDRDLIVENSRRSTTPGSSESEKLVFVGRVTGTKDCRWSDPDTQTVVGASVPLNREYALSSGLLEITYRSGARVILEGPCTFRVDSDVGGYLAVGKLTARIGERGERRGESAKPQAANPESRTPKSEPRNSSLIPHPSSFVVKTPTAIVTDLGTEFGVEVAENGDTTSYVFQGSIKVQGLAASAASGVVLHVNESIRVSRVRETHQDSSLVEQVRFTHPTTPPKFVRRLSEPPESLDVLDIIAGGDGTGKRRERGIDPSTGAEAPIYLCEPHTDKEHPYRLVNWHQLIDGVFIPDGRDGAVRLDSAGHRFDGFAPTSGNSFGPIWSREAELSEVHKIQGNRSIYWIYAMGSGEQFMPQRRGLLCLCANVGVTLDLEAIRKQFDHASPYRFHTTAGIVDASFRATTPSNMADVWVFVDGQVKFKRMGIEPSDGVFDIDVKLSSGDRYLTFVITDGGNGSVRDWFVFGDPILSLQSDENASHDTSKDNRKEAVQ